MAEKTHCPATDCEPHRGRLLLPLGRVAFACGVLSAFAVVPALIGLPLGVAVYVLARGDLVRMGTGRMDPEGKEQTGDAASFAALGLVFSGLALAICGPLLALLTVRIIEGIGC